jgi:hypothetical protein
MKELKVENKYAISTTDEIDFNVIVSRIGDNLPTLSEKALTKIQERMPEINRATKAFGRQNSPVENKLMSLNMISHSPYKMLKQCLSQIENKRQSLKDAYFKTAKDNNQLDRLEYKLQQEDLDEFDRRDVEIEIAELRTNMADTKIYVEGALKSIGDFQDAYEQIMKSNNIPEKWDERDFVEAEYENHIKTAFQHALRDIQTTGTSNQGTLEYFEQYGIKPMVGYAEAKKYFVENKEIDIESLYAWYDEMYEKYKDCPKKAMKHIGLDEIYNEDFVYLEKV